MGAGGSKQAHVVVVGGSFGGVGVAQALEKAGCTVTVISPNDGLFVNFGAPRAVVEAGFEKRLYVPTDRVLKKPGNKFVRGWASGVDPAGKKVTYTPVGADGKPSGEPGSASVTYDFLVLATGSSYGGPYKGETSSAEGRAKLASVRAATASAKKIVVVGGGATGIELAGELATDLKEAKVTLVHSGAHLMSSAATGGVPEKWAAKLLATVTGKGIVVKCGERVNPLPEGAGSIVVPGVVTGPVTVTTDKGSSIEADVVFYATGPRPNSAWLKDGPLGSLLTPQGLLPVNPAYQVTGHADIFCLGDLAGNGDAKAAWVLNNAAPIVTKNISKLSALTAAGKPVSHGQAGLKVSKGFKGMAVLALGRKDGIALGLPSFVAKKVKAPDFFTGMYAGKLGYKVKELAQ